MLLLYNHRLLIPAGPFCPTSVHHFRLTLGVVVLTSSPCGHRIDAIWLMFEMHMANVWLSLGQDEAVGCLPHEGMSGMILHTGPAFFDARVPSSMPTGAKALMPGDDVPTIRAVVPAFCLIQDSLWVYQCYPEPACGDEVGWACSMSASSHFLADSTFIVSIEYLMVAVSFMSIIHHLDAPE